MVNNSNVFQLGVCDYPEHVPQDHWQGYARQQKALGLTYVRIGEFAWSKLEPLEGEYHWDWLDQAVNTLHVEGLQVVLCTPTATPPAWLIRAHPEILPFDKIGKQREFGSRRHYDFSSELYREHSRRITHALAMRYGHHPSVVGWQTDNEFGCHDTVRSYGGASVAGFQSWLEAKYGTLGALNSAWGNVFWSQDYNAWSQILPPSNTVTEANPSHVLDFYRFSSDAVASFQEEQVSILRDLSPGRWVTHNFMIFFSDFDHYRASECLDFPSWDSYPTGMLEFFAPDGTGEALKTKYARTGHPDLISFNHDLYRGLKGGAPLEAVSRAHPRTAGHWVMEQQCGQVNWAPFNPLPAEGAVALWTAQGWAHGADAVVYFRWRAATMAQEVMHSGLLRHNETPDRGYAEVKALEREGWTTAPVKTRVALLHDYESLWIFDAQKHSSGLSYWTQTLTYYMALRSLSMDVDIVHPDSDLSSYSVIVAPAITLMTETRAKNLEAAAEHAQIVFGPRTAYRTKSGRTFEEGQFGPLTPLVGGQLENFDSLRPSLEVSIGDHRAHTWAESYAPTTASVRYTYSSGPLKGHAAVLEHGNVTVIGAHSETLIAEILSAKLEAAGLAPMPMPEGLRVSNRAGKSLVMNFNEEAVSWFGKTLEGVSFTEL